MLTVVHKNITFYVDPKLPSRLVWPSGFVDCPGCGITSLKAEKSCIIIEAGPETFRLTWSGPKDWVLADITPQTVMNSRREDIESTTGGPVRRKKS